MDKSIYINDIHDQHIWAIIKLLYNILKISTRNNITTCFNDGSQSFYDWIYNRILEKNKQNSKLLNMIKTANLFIKNHMYSDIQYILSIFNSEKMVDKFGINNSLSFTNFFGSETYYTRGAFIDVVVNQQMLKNNNIIPLDTNAYLDSFIENLSDYLLHDFNFKYLKRADNALYNIIILNNDKVKSIQYDDFSKNYCKKIIDTVDFIFEMIDSYGF